MIQCINVCKREKGREREREKGRGRERERERERELMLKGKWFCAGGRGW